MYTCERCGAKVADAYTITKFFNGVATSQIICRECILKIGHDNGIENNDSNMSDADSVVTDREE